MKEDMPSSSLDKSNADDQIERQIDHVMSTQGVSRYEAQMKLGISNDEEIARRALAKSLHPSSGHPRVVRPTRPPVGEDSVWTPVEDLTPDETELNKGFVPYMRGVIGELQPDVTTLTPLELAQRRAREDRRNRNR